jgi:hypothetical protein
MPNREYDLSSIANHTLSDVMNDNSDNILIQGFLKKSWTRNNKVYNILKYDKDHLTYDMVDTIGLWRSVICSNKKINVFSPPKSLNSSIFMEKYNASECIAEEFIEGTMINLFYDQEANKWEIASKTSVGCDVSFFRDQPMFSELFSDVCEHLELDVSKFSKEYCYNFVLQHPKNKFVLSVSEKKLYLIAMYKINNDTYSITEYRHTSIYQQSPITTLDPDILQKLSFPIIYDWAQFHEQINLYASMNTVPNIMGVVIYHKDGTRAKFRNPNYEYIKHLRGNNTKLQYQYLCLRKMDKVKEYLKYFSGASAQFSGFREQIHKFTDTLYQNYISCYIKKNQPLKEYPIQYRSHMFNLHQHYLSIREDKGYINKLIVIGYINNLEPAKLMGSINYNLRLIGKQQAINETTAMETDKKD